jgi:hypothetical protein
MLHDPGGILFLSGERGEWVIFTKYYIFFKYLVSNGGKRGKSGIRLDKGNKTPIKFNLSGEK